MRSKRCSADSEGVRVARGLEKDRTHHTQPAFLQFDDFLRYYHTRKDNLLGVLHSARLHAQLSIPPAPPVRRLALCWSSEFCVVPQARSPALCATRPNASSRIAAPCAINGHRRHPQRGHATTRRRQREVPCVSRGAVRRRRRLTRERAASRTPPDRPSAGSRR